MKRKVLKGILVLGGLFLLVAIPLYFFSNSGANNRLAEVKQTMLDKGFPTDLRELVEQESDLPPMGPVLERMTSLTLELPPGLADADYFARANKYFSADGQTKERLLICNLRQLTKDAVDSPSSMTAQQQADLIYIFDNNPGLWNLWREMAGTAPDFFYGADLDTPPWEWEISINFNELINKHRLTMAVSIALAKSGRGADAVAAWRLPVDGTRNILNNGNSLMGNLQVIQEFDHAMYACRNFVAYGEMNAAMLRELSEGLDGTAIPEGIRGNMMTDRLVMLAYLEDILKKETNPFASYDCPDLFRTQIALMTDQENQGSSAKRFVHRSLFMLGKPSLTQEISDMTERAMQWQEVMKLEPWEWTASVENLGLLTYKDDIPPWKIITIWSDNGIETIVLKKILVTEIQIQVTRLGLACEMWRLENGDLPPSLEVLAPKYIDAVAPDPFTGQPFEYTRSGNAFSIMSKMEIIHPFKDESYRVGWAQ